MLTTVVVELGNPSLYTVSVPDIVELMVNVMVVPGSRKVVLVDELDELDLMTVQKVVSSGKSTLKEADEMATKALSARHNLILNAVKEQWYNPSIAEAGDKKRAGRGMLREEIPQLQNWLRADSPSSPPLSFWERKLREFFAWQEWDSTKSIDCSNTYRFSDAHA